MSAIAQARIEPLGAEFSVPIGSPLAYIGNDSRTKRKKGEMWLRVVFD